MGTFNDGGNTLRVDEGDKRFADPQFQDDFAGLEVRVRAECVGSCIDFLDLSRSVGTQTMLDTVAQLTENGIRKIVRSLGDEVNADALGADQTYDLIDLFQ